jgi:hypothetical protein
MTEHFIATAVRTSEIISWKDIFSTDFMNKISDVMDIVIGNGPGSERTTKAMKHVYDNMM